MSILTKPLNEYTTVSDLRDAIRKGRLSARVTGCTDSQKGNLIMAVSDECRQRLILTENDIKARELAADLSLYTKEVLFYPSKDIIFYSADVHGNTIAKERLKILKKLVLGEDVTVVASITACMDRLFPGDKFKEKFLHITAADSLEIEALAQTLVGIGYSREGMVESPGQFAVRGGIIDIFPIQDENPVRIELWGDEIDSIRLFDAASQRSIENLEEIDIFPASELVLSKEEREKGLEKIEKEAEKARNRFLKADNTEAAANLRRTINEFKSDCEYLSGNVGFDSYVRYFTDETVSLVDYFNDKNACIFLDEPQRLKEAADFVEIEFNGSMQGRLEKGYILPGQMEAIYGVNEVFSRLDKKGCVLLSMLEYRFAPVTVAGRFDLTVSAVNSYCGNFEMLVSDLQKWKKLKYKVVLLAASKSRGVRLAEDLCEREVSAFFTDDYEHDIQEGQVCIVSGNLRRGFEYPLIKFAVITESDIFGVQKTKKTKKKTYDGSKIQDFSELNEGDYVVHENYGVGVYRGIEKIEVANVIKDYVKVEYAGGGTLYVLATAMGLLQKYAAADSGKTPKLNRLDSPEWKKTKSRVQGAVKQIASELIKLYALRQASEGFAFARDNVWQEEFEELFPFDETEDQLKAIEDTKRDMESHRIMDRLICGDVGYGKTEIAIRAAFKAVQSGKQVAVLVPTTILAQQHYNTFVQRMNTFAVEIEMLSRFKTASEAKKIIERVKSGRTDIIIGTHRLLSKDLSFKNLGLLIIDEEQRFGVTHKEKIKQIKGNVDVLTLTATPIPRTLHMSLSGIRDMSVLDEAPVDRLPIQTFVLEHNDEIIREAINREIARNGQVYYVYNRVAGIDDVAANIRRLIPDANVVYAHGRMSERELEQIMFDFVNGDIDVLVSTTIIETGLDISNVNTIIIDDADRFGLSQLYQLRGRVGRSNRIAYAFMMYRRDKLLKEVAEKRLDAIREFTELGSGIKIAMRDLEIRGAGNLLGAEQSGHMEAVGYDLYCKLLNQAVKTLKLGNEDDSFFETSIDLDMDAFIPSTYIRNELQKFDMYKRIATVETEELRMDLEEELIDRYGDMPSSVSNLLNIALTKAMAHNVYISGIMQKGKTVKLDFFERAKLDVAKFPILLEKYNGLLRLIPGKVPKMEFTLSAERGKGNAVVSPAQIISQLRALFTDMAEIMGSMAAEEAKKV
ncbi:MAG: transcription-repair coupling factor [Lachnospiraceae bacterium]|nr:transcription-repair coupling factor [Lachnospiraceae bacterium]